MIDTTTEEYQHFKEHDKVIVIYKDAKSKYVSEQEILLL